MTQHARLQPSAAAQTLQCHASVQLQEQHGLPEDPTTTEEGTAAHEVMAEMLEGVIVEPGARASNGVTVTEAMVDGAELLRDDIIETLGPDWRSLIDVEQTLPAGVFGPDNWGTPDVRTRGLVPDKRNPAAPPLRHIWDYKFGQGLVEVFKNPQLMNYGALSDPTLTERQRHVIVQPNAYHRDGPVRSWTTLLSMHSAFWNEMREAYRMALTPAPHFRVGPTCRYCRARNSCPEIMRGASIEREWSRWSLAFDPAVPLPAGAVAYELDRIDEAEALLKARRTGLEEQALAMIRSGQAVPGWEQGYGRGKVDWVQPVSHVINMGDMFGTDLRKPPRAITPKQALAAGMDPDMVRIASKHFSGEARLQRNNGERARRAFGGDE